MFPLEEENIKYSPGPEDSRKVCNITVRPVWAELWFDKEFCSVYQVTNKGQSGSMTKLNILVLGQYLSIEIKIGWSDVYLLEVVNSVEIWYCQ